MTETQDQTTYIVYARKSREDDENQIRSIPDQLAWVNRVIEQNKFRVLDVLTEEKSAKEPGRPVFDKVIKLIKKGKANGLITWQYNRLTRNPVDNGEIEWLLQQGSIQSIWTNDREYVPEDNALLLSIEGGMATQYVRELSKNVARGMQGKSDSGWFPGRAPAGYRNTKASERGTNTILKDGERFTLIRKVWDCMLTGQYKPDQILTLLNDEWSYRTRATKKYDSRPLSRSTIYKIFTNPFYMGSFLYKGKWYAGKHEPMVTPEEYEKVQLFLGRKGKPQPKKHEYAYTGLMDCKGCGSRITGTTIRKLRRRDSAVVPYTYYYCVKAQRKGCSQRRYINASLLDEKFASELSRGRIHESIVEWAVEILEREDRKADEFRASKEVAVKKKLAEQQAQLENLRRLCVRDLISEDEFVSDRQTIEKEILSLERSLNTPQEGQTDIDELTRRALRFAAFAERTFESGSPKSRRELFQAICLNCTFDGQDVALESPFWLEANKKYASRLRGHEPLLEPGRNGSTERQKDPPGSLRPILSAWADAVRTAIKKEGDRISIPILSERY